MNNQEKTAALKRAFANCSHDKLYSQNKRYLVAMRREVMSALLYIEGWTITEIARFRGRSTQTISSELSRFQDRFLEV